MNEAIEIIKYLILNGHEHFEKSYLEKAHSELLEVNSIIGQIIKADREKREAKERHIKEQEEEQKRNDTYDSAKDDDLVPVTDSFNDYAPYENGREELKKNYPNTYHLFNPYFRAMDTQYYCAMVEKYKTFRRKGYGTQIKQEYR